MDNRGIYVLGVQRGGTSAVAGVLHALGVNMGRWAPPEGDSYNTYEDSLAIPFRVAPEQWGNAPKASIAAGFREYLLNRRLEADGAPWGLKMFGHQILLHSDYSDLIRIVHVSRELNAVMKSHLKDCWMGFGCELKKVQKVAASWLAMSRAAERGVVANVSFPVMLYYPNKVVNYLVDAFDLEVTDEQRRAAVASVRYPQ